MVVWGVFVTFYGEPILKGLYHSKVEADKHVKSIGRVLFEDVFVERVEVADYFHKGERNVGCH